MLRIAVSGYKSIREVDLLLGPLTVLVGPNGAGKSNFIGAVELLGRIADGDLRMEVGLRGGAEALMHDGAKPPASMRLRVDAGEGESSITYEAVLVPAVSGELIFGREKVMVRGKTPHELYLRGGDRESSLPELEGGQSPWLTEAAGVTLSMLRGCRTYHFQDTTRNAPVKQAGYASDSDTLHPDARNLAAFLMGLRDTSPAHYASMVRSIRTVAPFFRDFVLKEDSSGRVRLRWKQQDSDTVFPAEALSDGTLRFVCLAALLLQPNPPALLVLDEPELGLHPFAITVLVEMLRSAALKSQVLVATQSVTLLDEFELSELVVAERVDGATELRRPDREALAAWLDDYSLGDLWLKNLLGGRPRPEQERES
jgi:predicted ATPase